ncbi:uncharacterized protein LOC126377301 [Pectinophora gossypiella]|uniref:uncharacterized protein LOC126377301 n=1 Tax=Pectinophora gossypiella TaxID=13191 RepID=UPI00214EE5F3|nr:uncharacterized protein LOC126377301 [Pectinophora gossypiella]
MAGGVFWIVLCGASFISGTSTSEDVARFLKTDDVMDVTDFSIYYDLKTNETIRQMMPRPWYWPGWMLRLPFQGGPCQCEGLQCSCCTGIQVYNFNRKSCANFTYNPEQLTIDMEVIMQNASVYKNTFSASNAPPFCIPIPVPYLPPGLVDMCIRLYNISIVDRKLHVCMDIDSRIDKSPVLVLHFDCMDMGAGGVSLSKPGGSNPTPADVTATTEPQQLDSDVYDPVTEPDQQPIKKSRSQKHWFKKFKRLL